MSVAIFRATFGNYSETFVRKNVECIAGGDTVVVCQKLGNDAKWANPEKLFILNNHFVFWRLWKLKLFLRRHKVKYVICEFLDFSIIMADFIENLKLPYVALGHGYDIGRKLFEDKNYAKKLTRLKNAKKIIVPSFHAKNLLLKNTSIPESTIIALPCGVSVEELKATDVQKDKNKFVFVGRFVEKKAPLLLILAFKKALDSRSDIRLTCIGDGPYLTPAKQIVRAFKLETVITFCGSSPHSVALAEISRSRALLQHSVTAENGDIEGLPVCVQEALALRTPVIVTRHAGLPEIVKDSCNGFLVDEFDIDAMAEAIIKMSLLSGSEYERMQGNCLETAESHLDFRRRIKAIESFIQ